MCNVTIVPRHKRHNSSHSKPQQQHIHVAAGLPRDLRFSHQLTRYKQAFALQTQSRHKVAATKHARVQHQITANNAYT